MYVADCVCMWIVSGKTLKYNLFSMAIKRSFSLLKLNGHIIRQSHRWLLIFMLIETVKTNLPKHEQKHHRISLTKHNPTAKTTKTTALNPDKVFNYHSPVADVRTFSHCSPLNSCSFLKHSRNTFGREMGHKDAKTRRSEWKRHTPDTARDPMISPPCME